MNTDLPIDKELDQIAGNDGDEEVKANGGLGFINRVYIEKDSVK